MFVFIVSRNVELWVFYFLCLTRHKVSLCYNATNHYLISKRTQMVASSAPTQQKNLAPGKNQECFCALAVCKTLGDFPDDTGWLSVVGCWSVVCVMFRIVRARGVDDDSQRKCQEISVRHRKGEANAGIKIIVRNLKVPRTWCQDCRVQPRTNWRGGSTFA